MESQTDIKAKILIALAINKAQKILPALAVNKKKEKAPA